MGVIRKDFRILFGKTIGFWNVICFLDKAKTTNKDKFVCQCELCGDVYAVRIDNLLNGKTSSCIKCGRIINDIKRRKPIETGTRFGNLVVVKQGEQKYSNGKSRGVSICVCDCGNTITVLNDSLRGEKQISCGCVSSVGEKLTALELSKYEIETSRQYSFFDLRSSNGGKLKFDFAIHENKNLIALVEYQSEPHRKDTGDFMRQQREETDALKKEYCKAHDIPLYEIWYDENIEQRVREILTELNLI